MAANPSPAPGPASSVEFDEAEYAAVRFRGPLTESEIERMYSALLSHPRYVKGSSVLWDFREATLGSVSTGLLQAIGGRTVKGRAKERGGGRSAFLTAPSQLLAFGVLRMFQGVTSVMQRDANVTIRVYRDLEAAEEWLQGR